MDRKEDIYIDLILLKKCTGDQLSQEELLHLSLWLQASQKHVDHYEKMMQFEYKNEEEIPVDLDAALERFRDNRQELKITKIPTQVKGRRLFRTIAIAASVTGAILVIGASLWLANMNKAPQTLVANNGTGQSESVKLITNQGLQLNLEDPSAMLESLLPGNTKVENNTLTYLEEGVQAPQQYTISTPHNKQYTVVLPDNTTVFLNQGSEIQYTLPFQGNERTVHLKGEAYFEVAKGEKPFVVHAGEVQVKAYGTEFNVNAYQKGAVKAMLVEGSIGIKSENGPGETLLKPQELAIIDHQTGHCIVKEVSSQGYLAWKTGAFSFKTVRLDEIMESIADHFGITEILYERESLRSQKLSAYITTERNLSEVLEWIAATTGLDITLRNGVIYLKEEI